MKNGVQLITYADRLGGDLAGLRALLAGPLAGLFSGVHILPFYYPIDGTDAGFDPIDHTRVDPRLGTWDDVAALASATDVMADVIVNHVSARSPQFQDFLERGSQSLYAGLFLTLEGVFPNGASDTDLAAIYRPRPGPPFTSAKLADGTPIELWTTFTREQIDIDVTHARGIEYLENILQVLARHGVSMVRLDAVGYAIKRPGTSCFMLDETFDFIRRFSGRAKSYGLEVLVEVHSYYQRQIEIARQVDRVYDFALPALVLHAFFSGTSRHLKDWIRIRPENSVTVLDTHDGIGVIDIAADETDRIGRPGLLPDAEVDRLVMLIHSNSNGQSERATGAAANNLDLSQVNCTFFDALGRNELMLLLSRAIQLFLPGIPQIYYVGLLAGENDMALLARTGVGRDINRHHYTPAEIDAALDRPVVRRLLDLIRLRNTHPAFDGKFVLGDSPEESLELLWRQGDDFARLELELDGLTHAISYSTSSGIEQMTLVD